MTLKGNMLLKAGVPALLLVMSLVVVKGCSSGDDEGEAAAPSPSDGGGDGARTLTPQEMDALGISGDSAQDTVATLVGKMNSWERQRQDSVERMEALLAENDRLTREAANVDSTVQQAIRAERQRQQEAQTRNERSLIERFEQRMDRLLPSSFDDPSQTNQDMPIGLGLEGGGGPSGTYAGGSSLTWVEPLDQREEDGQTGQGQRSQGAAFPTSFQAAADGVGGVASRTSSAVEARITGEPDASTVEPVYTIPENSTLMGSLSMTALLGRVPVDGTVSDPYPFKVMIGKDNLTANGIELPDVQAAVVSGTATGDWTLSCVRGNVTSMTFVFADGTVRTVPTPADVNASEGNGSSNNQDQTIGGGNSIGWISDRYGIPCISGMRRSNAQQYLGTQSLLTATGAGAASLMSDDDSMSVTSLGADGTISQAMSGNQAVSQILAQGVNDMSEWVNQLYGEAFAAIYVPPGQEVAIHINKQLPIDYETQGRKVRYDTSAAITHALD